MPLVIRILFVLLTAAAWAPSASAQPQPAAAAPPAAEAAARLDRLEVLVQSPAAGSAELTRARDELAALRQRTEQRVAELAASEEAPGVALERPTEDRAVRLARHRTSLARLDALALSLDEREQQLELTQDLAAIEDRLRTEGLDVAELGDQVQALAVLRDRLQARLAAIDRELGTIDESLRALVPEAAPAPAAPEGGADPAPEAAEAAAPTPGEAVPPQTSFSDEAVEAALAGQSEALAAEVRQLLERRRRLVRWRGDYRLLLLRASRRLSEVQQAAQQRATAQLLQAGPWLGEVARASLSEPEQWRSALDRVVAGSVLPGLGRRPGLVLSMLAALAGLAAAGAWLGRRLCLVCERLTPSSFGARLLRAFLSAAARHTAWLLVLGGLAVLLARSTAPGGQTPFVAWLCYALLLFLGLRIVNRTLLAPFAPAAPFTSLPRRLEFTLARRVTMLLLLGVLGFLLFHVLREYALPTNPFLLVRAVFVALLTVNLGWLLWLVGRVPGLVWLGRQPFRVLALVLLGGALAAEVAGYRDLSAYLLKGVLGSLLAVPALWIVRRLLAELTDTLLGGRGRWAVAARAWLDVVGEQPLPGMAWLRFLLGLGYWVGTLMLALWIWATEAGYATAVTWLDQGFQVGALAVVPSRVVISLALVAVLLMASAVARALLQKALQGHGRIEPGARDTVATLAGYTGTVVAVLIGLRTLGVNLATLAVVAGALSVGIGFGLQNVVSNFVSGLILLFERPIRAGDWVEVGQTSGIVTRVSVRSTRIRTFDRAEVVVPNSELLSQAVVNRTRYGGLGRIELAVGVAYGSDLAVVRRELLEAARAHSRVLDTPSTEPKVVFRGFGESSIDLVLWCFVDDVNQGVYVQSDLLVAVDERFREHGIEIPFPRTDLALINVPEPLAQGAAASGSVPVADQARPPDQPTGAAG